MAASSSVCPQVQDQDIDEWWRNLLRDSDYQLQDYEMQYFGFTAKSFVDGVFNAFMYYICDMLDVLQSILEKECSNCLPKGKEKEPLQGVVQKIVLKFKDIFEKLELYLKQQVFVIPSHALLPEDAVHAKRRYTASDEAELDADIADLKRKIAAEQKRQAALQLQLVQANSDLAECSSVADELKAAERATTSGAMRPGDGRQEASKTRQKDSKKKSGVGRRSQQNAGTSAFLKMAESAAAVHRLMRDGSNEQCRKRPPAALETR